jgi:hypothetical protein
MYTLWPIPQIIVGWFSLVKYISNWKYSERTEGVMLQNVWIKFYNYVLPWCSQSKDVFRFIYFFPFFFPWSKPWLGLQQWIYLCCLETKIISFQFQSLESPFCSGWSSQHTAFCLVWSPQDRLYFGEVVNWNKNGLKRLYWGEMHG